MFSLEAREKYFVFCSDLFLSCNLKEKTNLYSDFLMFCFCTQKISPTLVKKPKRLKFIMQHVEYYCTFNVL